MKKIKLLYIVSLILLAACKPSIDEFSPSKGNADFSSYIAVGDSWTSGMADGSLYKSGQEYSFPNILAGQFNYDRGGFEKQSPYFKQPLMIDDYGFGLGTGTAKPKMEMGFHKDCKDVLSLVPAYADVQVDPANFASVAAQGPFNNISIPGMKMGMPGMDSVNPYYRRFASAPTNSLNDEIPLVNATFFTLWIGSYDILGYAIGGGNDTANTITPVETFIGSIQATLAVLTANGAKGAIANIPDITEAAFFHTIPYNVLAIPDQATADALNAAYAGINMLILSLDYTDTLHFTVGQNPIVIQDTSLAWGRRQIRSNELVLLSLPQDSLKCGGWGSQKPVPANFILDAAEIFNIQQAVDDYNDQISQLVSGKEIALVDMYSAMKGVNDGLAFEGVKVNSRFVTGNFYSTDGLNPSFRGNAVIAYYFIEAINAKFDANIPQVIVSDFPGVKLP